MVAGGTSVKTEDFLAMKTHKRDGIDVARRVFYTLNREECEDSKSRAHRNSKAIAMVIKYLAELGILREQRMDDTLLEVIS